MPTDFLVCLVRQDNAIGDSLVRQRSRSEAAMCRLSFYALVGGLLACVWIQSEGSSVLAVVLLLAMIQCLLAAARDGQVIRDARKTIRFEVRNRQSVAALFFEHADPADAVARLIAPRMALSLPLAARCTRWPEVAHLRSGNGA